ncbi:DUF1801 domain-containing protein [Lysobacter capsici]|uniref:DUF1801 domain-containing protein n=1 Tax=Lysobacter capsici TaxID=435897 RepID=UPI001C008676|nr:DUF1801 domain-containing protein [Lysobacter capsici]QWF15156.1 DUF1801 domain-containing protein [Lysobacter capsici]
MKKATPLDPAADASAQTSASEQIDAKIQQLGDWRGQTLARIRMLIKQADPDVVEEVKWRGVPVWSHDGIVCTGETYKAAVKMTFAKGASLDDPAGLFNSSLDGNTRRAIDIHEGDKLDEKALKALIRAAAALNTAARAKPRPGAAAKKVVKKVVKKAAKKAAKKANSE